MMEKEGGILSNLNEKPFEMLGLLGEPAADRQWVWVRSHKTWRPPTDVYETDEHVIVKVEVAGMRKEDFSISLDSKVLTVSGVRYDPADKLGYQQMEIRHGAFETSVHIPKAIEETKIEAVYHEGFLVVRLPKARPRRVPVVDADHALL